MSEKSQDSHYDWSQYYKFSTARPSREFLYKTVKRFDTAGFAIDLGCGAGSDSAFLLEQGWRVLAIDQQAAAIEALRARVPLEAGERLETLVAPFKSLALPTADLIWAGLSLPFCRPDYFETLWGKICGAVVEGGRFAGDFFGRRHAWADSEKMTFHSKEQVVALCEGLHLEYIVEEEGETNTASNGVQHWHMFTVCAKKLKWK